MLIRQHYRAQQTVKQMVQDAIESLLRQKLGLDANSVGSRLIERAVEQRQIACRVTDRAAYLALLRSSLEEMNHLIEAVVVPETWFFRDKQPFEYLRHYVEAQFKQPLKQPQAEKNQTGEIFRVLSLPCSTGEEPYSIAITLLEAGLTSDRFRVDAIDVSQQALLKAKQGVYRKKSFRGGAIENLEHYFQPQTDGYAVRSIVRQSVNFKQGNVLDPTLLTGKQYQAIFCRNLLIYLDEAARNQVIASLNRALLPMGLLFLGSAETSQMADWTANRAYQAIDHPFAFAYQKILAADAVIPTVAKLPASNGASNGTIAQPTLPTGGRVAAKVNRSSVFLPRTAAQPTAQNPAQSNSTNSNSGSPVPPSVAPPLQAVQNSPAAPTLLETAKQLADRGELMKAAQLCESFVRVNPAQPNAYLLLGEIYQGLNQPHQAERCFQKAVYLNPNAYEALIHLALLKEQQGNRTEAARLRRRAQRVEQAQE